METGSKTAITVVATVNAPVEKVWRYWTEPKHIIKWCHASDDWHAPHAENDLKVKGTFTTTMAAKDGSVSFDFGGVYTNIKENREIEYAMHDGRKVKILFSREGDKTKIMETFEAENVHPHDVQRGGWQAILDNFKKYTEKH